MNVKKIQCHGPLTYQIARMAITVDYVQQSINHANYSGRNNLMKAAKHAQDSMDTLLEQFKNDVRAIQNNLNKSSSPQGVRNNQNTNQRKQQPKPQNSASNKAQAKGSDAKAEENKAKVVNSKAKQEAKSENKVGSKADDSSKKSEPVKKQAKKAPSKPAAKVETAE